MPIIFSGGASRLTGNKSVKSKHDCDNGIPTGDRCDRQGRKGRFCSFFYLILRSAIPPQVARGAAPWVRISASELATRGRILVRYFYTASGDHGALGSRKWRNRLRSSGYFRSS